MTISGRQFGSANKLATLLVFQRPRKKKAKAPNPNPNTE